MERKEDRIPRKSQAMEDSSELHSEENRVSPEKNSKRTLKTPAQVIALENFYNEHKYPAEELKSELAEQIGLTEKQISSWFCHRRLKDKRLKDEAFTNGRQDRSSGIVQDHGSGLWQDSCGSTKQGDYRNVDPREVESQRLYGHDFPAAELTYDRTSRFTGHVSGMDDTSSESSSSLQDKFLHQRYDPCDIGTSRYPTQNGVILPLIPKSANNMAYKPSGYLKVKGEIENAAVTAVKRQLGELYREDGPSLGVEFQPLPPGAFAAPSRDPFNGPFYVGDRVRSHSPDVSVVRKPSSLSTRYEVPSSKISSQDSFMEGANFKHEFDSHDRKSQHQLKRKSTSCLGGGAMNKYDDLAGETSVYNCRSDNKISSKCGVGGIRSDSVSNHHGPNGRKVSSEQTEPWLHNYNSGSPNIVQRNDYMSKPSNLIVGSSQSLDVEERRPFTRIAKEGEPHGKMKVKRECHDPVRTKMHPANSTTVAKAAKPFRVEFPHEEYATKTSFAKMPPRTHPTIRSTMEKPSSFSEDETAETSSSVD